MKTQRPTATRTLPEGYRESDALDFRTNRRQLLVSYGLRLVGLLVFVPLFGALSAALHPELQRAPLMLVDISLPGLGESFSILFVALDVVIVLWLHELVHGAAFRLAGARGVRIGVRGLVIYAAAPECYVRRNAMIANALAPVIVLSLLGLLLLATLPISALSWVFIPVVINAAAAGGDFQFLFWLRATPREALVLDRGDVIVSYVPVARA